MCRWRNISSMRQMPWQVARGASTSTDCRCFQPCLLPRVSSTALIFSHTSLSEFLYSGWFSGADYVCESWGLRRPQNPGPVFSRHRPEVSFSRCKPVSCAADLLSPLGFTHALSALSRPPMFHTNCH